ncbi:hypothetical protein FDZ71_07395, partial [bacterium]
MKYLQRIPALRLGLALGALVFLAYLPTVGYDFCIIDDSQYVRDNPLIKDGINLEALAGAFKVRAGYWIPVTWLSLMADSLYSGIKPWGYHLTNALLHAANALLLYLFFHKATGSKAKSLFVAAIWALHPMRVESVAWITSRKDLLSALFLLLALHSYLGWLKKRAAAGYAALFLFLLLGLMAKPILVAAPLLLLAVDVWPLERISSKEEAKKAVLEKIPLFALSAAFAALTITTQKPAIRAATSSVAERFADLFTSASQYFLLAFWPADVSVTDSESAFRLPLAPALLAALAFCLAVWFFWRGREKRPYLLAGILWFFAALLPVSGVVPVGLNFTANRFTY